MRLLGRQLESLELGRRQFAQLDDRLKYAAQTCNNDVRMFHTLRQRSTHLIFLRVVLQRSRTPGLGEDDLCDHAFEKMLVEER